MLKPSPRPSIYQYFRHALLASSLSLGIAATVQSEQSGNTPRSPGQIIKEAPASSWRNVAPENTLLLQLEAGEVVIELAPQFAPGHVANIKALAREGFYQGLSIYRFVDGFVAQGGDASEKKAIKTAKRSIPGEPYSLRRQNFTLVDSKDGYAFETGFVDGFAAARNKNRDQTWMVHCHGIFAMARGDSMDSGGTEFYITIGHAPRYLDRNITVFGRVLKGMQYVQSLQREKVEGKAFNRIVDIKVAADVDKDQRGSFQVMKTDSDDFRELIESRRNRPESWFLERPGYVDICGVPVPSREN